MGSRFSVALTLLVACGPAVGSTPGGSSSSGEIASSGTTAVPTTTGSDPTTSGASSSSTTVQGESSDASTTGCVPDGPTLPPNPDDPESRCSVVDQDCGCGLRCTLYIPDEDTYYQPWDNSGCFPADPEPVALGEPCVHEDFTWSGRDNCPVGAMCEDFDRDGVGVCREFCHNSMPDECTEPDAVPWVGCQECGCVCQVSCDPRDDGCGEGNGCYLRYNLGICGPTVPEPGQQGDPCEFENGCAPGLACIGADSAPDCDPKLGSGCCTPYCDVSDPVCPEGSQCEQLWAPGEAAAPILEDLGYCILPS